MGFSYPSVPADDKSTADDTYTALLAFIDRHDSLIGRPFFIAGESYGGHYVPNTAKAIQDGNAALALAADGKRAAQHIDLVGFMVGNGALTRTNTIARRSAQPPQAAARLVSQTWAKNTVVLADGRIHGLAA